jgi:creatinine amidohydrolase/Fe(II)-dependent formamide hydrolase-like protein
MIATRLCAIALFVASSTAALAQAPTVVSLESLTWTELADEIRAGKTTILVPIGATEQSGPHMALGKHNARAGLLAERIARALGNALVAPVVAYVPEGSLNPPSGHMRFPGTITVSDATFESVLESAGQSFRLHGFRDIVFLGDHGGYQKQMQVAAERLNRAWTGTPVRAHAIAEYYRAADNGFGALLARRGFKESEIGTHAGLADTSLTLALAPDLVRVDRLRSVGRPDHADGVHGDPRQASAELGTLGVDLIVNQSVAAIRAATSRR